MRSLVGCSPNAGPQAPPMAATRHERRLLAVACRVEPVVTHPAPPQTRTCAMHASGSSSRAAAALVQSPGFPWSGLVSSKSLPCVPPADALPDGACPPVGRLGHTSPPSPVLCAATTATVSLSGRFACRSLPDTLPASVVCGVPYGLVARRKLPVTPGPVVTRSPHSGSVVKETDGSPKFPSSPSEDMPRSQTPVVSSILATTHPGLLPASACTPSADHNSTHCGAQSRGL